MAREIMVMIQGSSDIAHRFRIQRRLSLSGSSQQAQERRTFHSASCTNAACTAIIAEFSVN